MYTDTTLAYDVVTFTVPVVAERKKGGCYYYYSQFILNIICRTKDGNLLHITQYIVKSETKSVSLARKKSHKPKEGGLFSFNWKQKKHTHWQRKVITWKREGKQRQAFRGEVAGHNGLLKL